MKYPAVEYRPIPGCPGYEVGNDGTIWTLKEKGAGPDNFNGYYKLVPPTQRRIKSMYIHHGGYPTAALFVDGKQKRMTSYQAVALAFIGPRPLGMQIRHLDGNPRNNRPENLRYGTALENSRDCIRHGRRPRGEQSKSAKLTTEKVLELKRLARIGVGTRHPATLFEITMQNVRDIAKGKTWKHLCVGKVN